MNKVTYAIIGCGNHTTNRIIPEGFALDTSRFKPLDNIKLKGINDIAEERKSVAEKYGLAWYNSVEDICNDVEVDAVFIGADNLSHYPIAKKLLQANKHLIIEKTLATTIEEAKELIEFAKKNRLSLTVNNMMANNSYNIRAKELIANGDLGDVNDIVLHMEFPYGYTQEEREQWRIANPKELAGPIGDVGTHCIYVAEFLLGQKITLVSATFTPEVNKLNIENGAFIRFKTEEGINGSIRVSFSDLRGALESIFLNLGYEVYGSKKTLRAYGTLFQLSGHPNEPIPLRLELDDFKSVETIKLNSVQNIYQVLIETHANSIRTGEILNATDALHRLELVLEAYSSAK